MFPQLTEAYMREREKEYCDYESLKLFYGTWNVCGGLPEDQMDDWFLSCAKDADIVFVGTDIGIRVYSLQEVVDLSDVGKLLTEQDSELVRMWDEHVSTGLASLGRKYKMVACRQLVGIMSLLYVSEELAGEVGKIQIETVTTGFLNRLGNKGSIIVRLQVRDSWLCLVNCHLCAHTENLDRRNAEYRLILEKATFPEEPASILDHDIVLWGGDLNYRLALSSEAVRGYIAQNKPVQGLLRYDQLLGSMRELRAFEGFAEGKITFWPTYKFDRRSDAYDSKKMRCPSYTDRVLYLRDNPVRVLSYTRHELLQSDHRPVGALFSLDVKRVNEDRRHDVRAEMLKMLSALENDCIPVIAVEPLEVTVPTLRESDEVEAAAEAPSVPSEDDAPTSDIDSPLRPPETAKITLRNDGQVVSHVSFTNRPGSSYSLPAWLRVSPRKLTLVPGESRTVELSMIRGWLPYDDEPVEDGKEGVEEFLILHVDHGRDFFVTVRADKLPPRGHVTIDADSLSTDMSRSSSSPAATGKSGGSFFRNLFKTRERSESVIADVSGPRSISPRLPARSVSFRRMLRMLSMERGAVRVVKFSPLDKDLVAFAGSDGLLYIVNVSSPRKLHVSTETQDPPVQADPEDSSSSTLPAPQTPKDTASATETLRCHSGNIYDIDWSFDGHFVVTAGGDRICSLIDTEARQVVRRLATKSPALAVRFAPSNQNIILAGTQHGRLLVFSASSGTLVREVQVGSAIQALCTDRAGQLVFCGCADGAVHVYHFKNGMEHPPANHVETKSFQKVPSGVVSLDFTQNPTAPDMPFLCCGTEKGELHLFGVKLLPPAIGFLVSRSSLQVQGNAHGPKAKFFVSSLPDDPVHVVAGRSDGSIAVYNMQSSEHPCANRFDGHSGAVVDVSWNNDRSFLASGDADGMVIVWERESEV